MSKKIRTIMDTRATLDNRGGGWKVDAHIVTTNGNALELTITQPVDESSVTKILLYNTNLQELCGFGEKICKIASLLMRKEAEKK